MKAFSPWAGTCPEVTPAMFRSLKAMILLQERSSQRNARTNDTLPLCRKKLDIDIFKHAVVLKPPPEKSSFR
jgi:hypothetical protein